MHRLRVLVAPMVAGVVVLAAACGSDERGGGVAAADPRPPSAGDWRSVPWKLVRVDGKQVTVRYEGGGCIVGEAGDTRAEAVAAEDGRVVTLAVYLALSNPCAGVLVRGTASVRLSRPLGDRRVAHAPVDGD